MDILDFAIFHYYECCMSVSKPTWNFYHSDATKGKKNALASFLWNHHVGHAHGQQPASMRLIFFFNLNFESSENIQILDMIVAILKVAKIQGRRYRKDIFASHSKPKCESYNWEFQNWHKTLLGFWVFFTIFSHFSPVLSESQKKSHTSQSI